MALNNAINPIDAPTLNVSDTHEASDRGFLQNLQQMPDDSANQPVIFQTHAELEAYLDHWSIMRGLYQSSTTSRATMASQAENPARKEADRILWKRLPIVASYEDWRFTMFANVAASAIDQEAIKAYLASISTEEDVSSIPNNLSGIDAKLKAALLSAVQEAPDDHRGRIMAAYGNKPEISGRELFRIIDKDYGLRTDESLAQKNVSLLTMKCASFHELGDFLIKWKKLDGVLVGTDQDIPESTKLAFMRRILQSVPEVSAILAQNRASHGTYIDLVDNLTNFEAINRTWEQSGNRKPIAAAAKPNFRPCSYCSRKYKGKKRINHTDDQCYSNPESKNYRPFPAKKGTTTNKPKPNKTLNDETIQDIVALVAKQLKPSESPAETDGKACMARTPQSVALDSGASYSISGPNNALGTEIEREALDKPMRLECVGGSIDVFDKVVVNNPTIGFIEALHVENSPPLLSLGQLLRNGYSFAWNGDQFKRPMLTCPSGKVIPLELENFTPVLPLAASVTPSAPVSMKIHDHSALHVPMVKDCTVCQVAKMKRAPARRSKEDSQTKASTFLERVSIDLIEVAEPDFAGNKYLFTLRDDFSGFIGVRAQKSKAAAECLSSFQDIIRNFPKVPEIVRSDQGREFEGEFETELKRLYIQREYAVPYRSTSNSRIERLNQELNRAARCLLFASGLPLTMWSYAAAYFEYTYNHLYLPESQYPRNPCEIANGVVCTHNDRTINLYNEWPNFGCLATYVPKSHEHKFESRARMGIVVGITSTSDLILMDAEKLSSKMDCSAYTVITTRDAKVRNTIYPARSMDLRSGTDLLFYKLMRENEAIQQQKLCLQCKQIRPDFPVACVKCKDSTSSQKHTRDVFCQYGRCRCKLGLPTFTGFEPVAETYWELDDELDEYNDEAGDGDVLYGNTQELTPTHDPCDITLSYGIDAAEQKSENEWDDLLRLDESGISGNAFLTKMVDPKYWLNTKEGREALKDEVNNMINHGVWSFESVIPKEEAKKIADAKFVPVKLIMGMKNMEMEPSKRKLKARLVAQGCNSKDAQGMKSPDTDFPYEAPASLLSFRLATWWATLPEMDVTIADIKSAYLHAPLKGAPVFLSLPKELQPEEWSTIVNPVVRANKALYGLNRSGSDFGDYLRNIILSYGWKQSSIDQNLYFKNRNLLVCYVDDLYMVTRRTDTMQERSLLKNSFDISDETTIQHVGDIGKYLGMTITRTDSCMQISSREYLDSILKFYCNDVDKPALRNCKTPTWTLHHAADYELDTPGVMRDKAAGYVGRLLWLARTSRPDISFAAGYLGRMVASWSLFSDRCLARIMGYLYHHRDFQIRYSIKNEVNAGTFDVTVFTDSDHANSHAKSTSGFVSFIGDGTRHIELVHWGSKLQTSTALSSTEAELIACVNGVKNGVVTLESFLEECCGGEISSRTTIFMDSEPAIKAIMKGFSPRMQHLSRVHRVSLDLLHDQLCGTQSRDLKKISSAENIADLLTKDLPAPTFRSLVEKLSTARNIGDEIGLCSTA
jgi:hypothetical protein